MDKLYHRLRHLLRQRLDQDGQTLTEYALVLGLIVLVSVAALGAVGQAIISNLYAIVVASWPSS